MAELNYDIVINGGGIVGLTLACAMGGSELRIAVIEGKEPELDWPEGSIDLRVSAITRASQKIFQSTGAWDSIKSQGISPYRDMRVWDALGKGAIHFDSAELAEPELGYIIENRVMRKALIEALKNFSNIDFLCPLKIQNLEPENKLLLSDGQSLNYKLLVGADGANSWVREQAKIKITEKDYEHFGIVATVTTEKLHQKTAWQRFLPTGPLAFLPLKDEHTCSIVWSCIPEEKKPSNGFRR